MMWTVSPTSLTSTKQGIVTSGGTLHLRSRQADIRRDPGYRGRHTPRSSAGDAHHGGDATHSSNGYSIFGQQLNIDASDASGAGSVQGTTTAPIKPEFALDKSQIPVGIDISHVTVTRNGSPAADCDTHDGTASPDPSSRPNTDPDGGLELVILTTDCSTWNFATTTPISAPVNSTLPAITGTTTVGETLSEAHGAWSNTPTSYSHQWQHLPTTPATSCTPIAGATGRTYTLTSSDIGHTIVVQETAQNLGGTSTTAASAPSAIVKAATPDGGGGGGTPGSASGGGTPGSGSAPQALAPARAVAPRTARRASAAPESPAPRPASQSPATGRQRSLCHLTLSLTITERSSGAQGHHNHPDPARKRQDQDRRTRDAASITLAGGKTHEVQITLHETGLRLLAKNHRLAVSLNATQATAGHSHTLPYRTITFTIRQSTKTRNLPHSRATAGSRRPSDSHFPGGGPRCETGLPADDPVGSGPASWSMRWSRWSGARRRSSRGRRELREARVPFRRFPG